MTPAAPLSQAELEAVATIWKRQRRELSTAFGGTSMLPAIAPGHDVIVDCGREPGVGDVAVFRFGNQLGVHRVAARGTSWLLTWGDANPLPDEPIAPAQVLGVIRDPAAFRRGAARAMLLWFIAAPGASAERLTRRVRLLYAAKTAYARGPIVFVGKALRALFRRGVQW